MSLNPGDRLGPYLVIEPLGRGGMGEVFKARDTRLNRFVAVKLIGCHLREHEESRRRLMLEARAIAALSHPHICALYDTGHQGGLDFLVLEYLEGETLAERLTRGPLPIRDLLGWAIEIAQALEYAHRRGVVHRDLKPSNVFITSANRAKLMDFGLAAIKSATTNDLSQLGTQPVRVTAEGALLGTLHYLAPERLNGAEADARSDVFSYGAVLYEMLTGKPPFDEPTQAQLIASILTREPEGLAVRRDGLENVRGLVRSCLVKAPEERWQSMADAAIVLRSVASTLHSSHEDSPVVRRRSWLPAAAAGALALAAMGVFGFSWLNRGESRARYPVSFTIEPPAGGAIGLTDSTIRSAQFAVAPDGTAVAFVASAEGHDHLWVRHLGEIEPRALEGTSGASYPFWSPDSRHIGFFVDRKLKRVAAAGGPAQLICDATNGRGGAWNAQDDIVFVPNNSSPLHRVKASGGTSQPIAALPAQHNSHRWPQFLPDGNHLLFLARGEAEGLYVTSLTEPTKHIRVRPASSSGFYASGHLLYVVDGGLVAQPFDPETLTARGDATALGLSVSASSTYYSALSASQTGVLVTWSGGAVSDLIWFGRTGTPTNAVVPRGRYVDFRLSPDARRLAFARVDDQAHGADVWAVELARGVPQKLTSSPQTDASPVWAPDSRRLVFRSNRSGIHEMFEHPGLGNGAEQRLFGSDAGIYPTDWSADGKAILYHQRGATTAYDIASYDVTTGKVATLVSTRYDDVQGQLARDGRLAFTSSQSGQFDVYVSSTGEPKAAERVSADGGSDPRWRSDGRELFFIAADGTLMAVDTAGTTPGAVKPLFKTLLQPAASPFVSGMIPSADGQRFLLKVPVELPQSRTLTVTTDWPRRLSPTP